jgi:hypothetical protein
MMTHSNTIAYLAVARVRDGLHLAVRFDKGTVEAERKILSSSFDSLLSRASRLNLSSWKDQCQCSLAFDGSVYALGDPQNMFMVAVGVRGGLYPYPPRLVWELLQKLLANVQGADIDVNAAQAGALSLPLKKPMLELMQSYNEPGEQDAVTQVQEKVDAIKSVMEDNVKKIVERHTTLEALQDKSAEMNSSAEQFVRTSVNLKRQMELRNLKVKAIIVVAATALGTYVLLPFFQ